MKRLLLVVFGTATFAAQAQDFGEILATGADNAETYLGLYSGPTINAFGNAMADGWYNTGKTHSLLGFNLTISPSVAFIPNSDKTFTFDPNDFTDLTLSGDSDNELPTLVGGDAEAGSQLIFSGEAKYSGITIENDIEIDVPNGVIDLSKIPFAGVPAPTYNIGIGLIKNTDLKIRYMPEITSGDFRARMFGLGIQHDIKQWIPGIKVLPFDLSVLVASSKLTMEYDIEVNESNSNSTFEGSGTAEFSTTSTTAQLIVSKKLLFFTPYLGVGMNAIKSNLDVNGDYTYTTTLGGSSDIKDPISLEYESGGSMRTTIGAQLKFAVVTLHGSYTVQKYNTVNFGIGVSLR